LLRILAIGLLVFLAIRFILRIFKSADATASKSAECCTKERYREGDVIIEYEKPTKKKPKVDADDVDFEVIE
jgi:hypothetical protein